MSIPVNLYVDRMSPVQPVRVADVYAVTQDRASAYTEAAAMIGLTTREYVEFRQALLAGGAVYVRLPRRIDAMAGVHKRNGRVYALKNVLVPTDTMGWQVNLADGTTVLVPRICGNLSMNRGRAVAHVAPKRHVVRIARQGAAVRGVSYVAPAPVHVASTPVSFDVPQTAVPIVAVAPAAAPAVVAGHSALPFLGLLVPVIGALSGAHAYTAPATPAVAACSQGSNEIGVCHL